MKVCAQQSNPAGKPHVRRAALLRGFIVALLLVPLISLLHQAAAAADEPVSVPVKINKLTSFDLSSSASNGEQFIGIDEATNGVATIGADGTGAYMPDANFVGPEPLRAWLKAPDGSTRAISVVFDITGTATGAEARGDYVETAEDTPVIIYPLGNDAAGPGGGPLITTIESAPVHGIAEVLPDGSILFTPKPNWNGGEEFWYRASDGVSAKSAPIGVNVISVRDVPTATADAIVIRQGEDASIDVLVNDFDGDGDQFWLTSSTPALSGTASWSDLDRMFIYRPDPAFYGVDQFTYTIADGDGQSIGTVTITVDGAPIAVEDAVQVERGGSISLDPRANDTDPEGSALVITNLSKPAHGKASIKQDGSVSYRADDSSEPQDTFSYTVQDNLGNSATANVVVNRISDPAQTLAATDDEFLVPEDSAGNTLDLLGNDTVPDGASVTLTIATSPTNGTLVVDAMQLVTYVPNPEFSGPDSFAYTISGTAGTADALVSISVQPQNDLPVAGPDSAVTDEDTPVRIDVLANDTDIDGDELIVESVQPGALGSVEIDADGQVVYTPNQDAFGNDQFSYVVTDGFGGTAMIAVPVTINPVQDAPLLVDDAGKADPGQTIEIDILANDRDPDGEPLLNLTIVEQPLNGTASLLPNGRLSYQPNDQFEGLDSLIYSVSDPAGTVVSATVTILVGEPNSKPEAQPDTVTVVSGKAIRIDVLANDSDPDGDALSIYRVGKAEHGKVEIRGTKIRYEPEPGFVGTETITYRVTDGDDTDTGRITIVVTEP